MSCKLKEYHSGHSRPWCKRTGGECQFIVDDYDLLLCPMANGEKEPVITVDYITSTGHSWIDTETLMDYTTGFELEMRIRKPNQVNYRECNDGKGAAFMGCGVCMNPEASAEDKNTFSFFTSNQDRYIYLCGIPQYDNCWCKAYDSAAAVLYNDTENFHKVKVVCNGRDDTPTVYVDNVQVEMVDVNDGRSGNLPSIPMALMCVWTGTEAKSICPDGAVDIKSFRIFDITTGENRVNLVGRKYDDGTVGMWDTVQKHFHPLKSAI